VAGLQKAVETELTKLDYRSPLHLRHQFEIAVEFEGDSNDSRCWGQIVMNIRYMWSSLRYYRITHYL
jgi:hypothetical protein